MAEYLPHTITPIPPAELASALLRAWRELFGESPPRPVLLVLMAQSAHETGEWKHVHNYNIGNVKGAEGDGHDWTNFRCRERVNGKDVYFDPPHPATRFRAFRTLTEGCVDLLVFLKTRKRYAAAWDALLTGDPVAFATALKAGGYYTDPVEVYARGLRFFFNKFDRMVPAEVEPPDLDEWTVANVKAQVALSLDRLRAEAVARNPPDEPNA